MKGNLVVQEKILKNFETRFNDSNYELEILLLRGKNKKRYWINERYIKCTTNDRACRIENEEMIMKKT